MWKRRITELVALTMIGEGVVMLSQPRRYLWLWRGGPQAWTRMIDGCAARPKMMRACGVFGIVAGLYLALRQLPRTRRSMPILDAASGAGGHMMEMGKEWRRAVHR